MGGWFDEEVYEDNGAVQISGGESYSRKGCLPTLHKKCFCFWDEKEDYNALSWVRHDGRLWSAFKRVWKQLKSVSRVAELSFAERLQGS